MLGVSLRSIPLGSKSLEQPLLQQERDWKHRCPLLSVGLGHFKESAYHFPTKPINITYVKGFDSNNQPQEWMNTYPMDVVNMLGTPVFYERIYWLPCCLSHLVHLGIDEDSTNIVHLKYQFFMYSWMLYYLILVVLYMLEYE